MTHKDQEIKNYAIVHIITSFNNIMISVTDIQGNVLLWSSAGQQGFKGSKKSTPFAAQMVAEQCAKKLKLLNIKDIFIKISGPGQGRDISIRSFYLSGFKIASITDVTAIPHNGCRPKKSRRI